MPHVRVTLIQPNPGQEEEVLRLLQDLDKHLSASDGLVLSAVIRDVAATDGHPMVGRIAMWQSADHANRASMQDHVLAVRSRMHNLGRQPVLESLFEVKTGFLPADLLPLKKRPLKAIP